MMVNPLSIQPNLLSSTDLLPGTIPKTSTTSSIVAPQATPNVGLGTLFQSLLLSVPQEPRELAAQALEKGAPVLGGAGGAMAAGLCGACLLGIAGGAMAGRDLGGILGNLGASAIRGPGTPAQ